MYYKDQKKLASIILDCKQDGKCKIAPAEVQKVYSERFGRESKEVDLSRFPRPEGQLDPKLIHCPFTSKEVKDAITNMSKKTASGPDRVKAETVAKKDKDGVILAGLYNLWLITASIPDAVKANNSILLPKKDPESTDIGDWRPLTIASVLLRLYTKILAKRMTEHTPLCPRQRGFIKAAGCAENLTLVRTLIDKAKLEGGIAVAFLDLAKAFDTVSHKLVFEGMRRLGGDDHMVKVIANLYHNTETSFTVADGCTDKISIKSGVKQGDPLSPVLFNIAMDPLFCLLEQKGRPYKSGRTKLCSLAYADDTACVSSTIKGLQHNVGLTIKFCEETGLKLNVKKCCAFVIRRWGKSYTINDCEPILVNGEQMPWIEPGETCKYLGGKVGNWSGNSTDHKPVLQQWCQRIDKAPLKPRQKVALYRTYVCPRIVSKLEVEPRTVKGNLRELDVAGRYWVRKWLNLPKGSTNHVLYAPFADGGLGLTRFETGVLVRKVNRLKACLASSDRCIRSIATDSGFEQDIRDLMVKLDTKVEFEGNLKAIKRLGKKVRRKESIKWGEQGTQGLGAECFRNNRLANTWLAQESFLKESEFLTALKLRTNTYPTRECMRRTNNNNQGEDINCRTSTSTTLRES